MSQGNFKFLVIGVLLLAVVGCGRGGSSSSSGNRFWAYDLTTDTPRLYQINASKVAEGAHCYIYLEQGQSLTQNTINAIVNEFDNNIYLNDTGAFGEEPNPGVDNDPKIYILLLNLKDGFNGTTNKTYIAGYFDPGNEYPRSANAYSNQKEMIYLDTYPLIPASSTFFTVLAHEFQHMIHWEQEQEHKNGIHDDTWLNEGMSEIAPAFCGYGPSYNRILTFENAPSDSLTVWNNRVEDYGVVYMWAQYFKDRFAAANPQIFRSMLQNSGTGIDSVGQAVGQIDSSLTFSTTFRDWAIANYSGNSTSWPGRPQWSYTSIDTSAALFTKRNVPLNPLDMWAVDYYSYSPVSGTTGTLTWNATNSYVKSALADTSPAMHPDLASGQSYTFSTTGYLILSNPSGTGADAGTVSNSSILPAFALFPQRINAKTLQSSPVRSPKAMLDAADENPVQKGLVRDTGEPQPFCVHPYFVQKERSLKARGARPRF